LDSRLPTKWRTALRRKNFYFSSANFSRDNHHSKPCRTAVLTIVDQCDRARCRQTALNLILANSDVDTAYRVHSNPLPTSFWLQKNRKEGTNVLLKSAGFKRVTFDRHLASGWLLQKRTSKVFIWQMLFTIHSKK
jgi:hypothetical protein